MFPSAPLGQADNCQYRQALAAAPGYALRRWQSETQIHYSLLQIGRPTPQFIRSSYAPP
jgi:hypothetical protein